MVRAWRWVKGKIQPVTALFTLLMLAAYLRSPHLHRLLHPQTSLAWRALLSTFYHKNGLHLFINLMWTLNIGYHFEKLHGSWCFLCTTTSMVFLGQGLALLVYLPYVFFTIQCFHSSMPSFALNSHTLGFSGVLFALHFLLVTSSPCYSREEGLFLSSRHHGLLIEGLFLLACLQTLILPDSYLFTNLCGILAGFLHIRIPSMSKFLLECSMIIHVEVLLPLYHTMHNILQKLSMTAKGYYHHLFQRYSQGRGHLYTNNSDDDGYQGQDTEDEEDEEAMDPTLQWECKMCLRKNGVFLGFCESCKEWRTLD